MDESGGRTAGPETRRSNPCRGRDGQSWVHPPPIGAQSQVRSPSVKRGQPLRRKTPLQFGTPPRRKTRLRARSRKREAVMPERRAYVARILSERPRCEARIPGLGCAEGSTPGRWAVDVHELVRRGQGTPIVPSQGLADSEVLAVCRPCHDFITDNPARAVALGLARWAMRENPVGNGPEGGSPRGTGY